MASQREPSFSFKILVDKELQKVVLAEATNDFVDILFSFLTLPLGTIIRLVGDKDLQHPVSLGSINNLYQSVESLGVENFMNNLCKNMLLNPRNPCELLCSKLLMNVDDTERTKHFRCSSSLSSSSSSFCYYSLSTFANSKCPGCGQLMDRGIESVHSSQKVEVKDGVFVQGGSKFLVSDDLKVMPNYVDNSLQLLIQLGYRDLSRLEETFISIDLQEILKLLKNVLISDKPLTNTFLENSISKSKHVNSSAFEANAKSDISKDDYRVNVKVVRSKSKDKIICVEAWEDFVDFIFGFLTIPLGSILKLLGGNSCVGCVDNLYNSVISLDKKWRTNWHSVLMDPGVSPQFGCPKQPLKKLKMQSCSNYYDPRAPNGKTTDAAGFVRRPASYVVGDDLQVSPLKSTSMLSFLKELNLPFDDIEVNVLSIGEEETLNLLRASLTSKSALNTGLADFVKTPKQETM